MKKLLSLLFGLMIGAMLTNSAYACENCKCKKKCSKHYECVKNNCECGCLEGKDCTCPKENQCNCEKCKCSNCKCQKGEKCNCECCKDKKVCTKCKVKKDDDNSVNKKCEENCTCGCKMQKKRFFKKKCKCENKENVK